MSRSARLIFRVIFLANGLAAAIYGAACWTGGWLGIPPHHGIVMVQDGVFAREVYPEGGLPQEVGREFGGFALMVVGAILLMIGAWPRRRRPTPVDRPK